jgi:methylase of polypeptide subunit release factors
MVLLFLLSVLLWSLSNIRDAGIAISCHMSELFEDGPVARVLLPSKRPTQLQILELGAGCGMVGITIAQLVEGARVLLTDLPEAQEIVKRNIGQASAAKKSTLDFQELNWDDELPRNLQPLDARLDLVIAADCTYNSDSR